MAKRRGTTKSGGQKDPLDKFYTKPEIVRQCLSYLALGTYARVIEPAAGDGAFLTPLQAAAPAGVDVVGLDLAPEHPDVRKQDWFTFTEQAAEPTLVVGNPPYGEQSALAVRFINHAFEVVGAQTVAFVLASGFQKASYHARIFPYAHLMREVRLPRNAFTFRGQDYDLPSVFQVWERSTTRRSKQRLPLVSDYFEFTKQDEPHDFAVRRVGGRAGFATTESGALSPQSNYFIRMNRTLSSAEITGVVAQVNSWDYAVAALATGPRSLSKREFVAIFDTNYRPPAL